MLSDWGVLTLRIHDFHTSGLLYVLGSHRQEYEVELENMPQGLESPWKEYPFIAPSLDCAVLEESAQQNGEGMILCIVPRRSWEKLD